MKIYKKFKYNSFSRLFEFVNDPTQFCMCNELVQNNMILSEGVLESWQQFCS